MKNIIFGFILLASTNLFAANKGYELSMDFSLDKKDSSSFQIMVREGQKGSYIQKQGSEEFFIEVVAAESSMKDQKGTLMKFVVGTIATDGKKTILGTPEILALENDLTKKTITVGDASRTFSLSVIAKKKAL